MVGMRAAAGVLALGVVVAACGGDDGGGDDASSDEGREYVEAIVAANEQDEEQLGDDLSEDDQECVARAMVDAIGLERLQEAVTPDEIRENPDAAPADLGVEVDEEQAEAFWDGLNECVDVRELFRQGLAEDEDLSEEARACLEDEFDDDFIKRLLVTMMVEGEDALEEDEELLGEMFGVFAACPGAIDLGD